MMNNTFTRVFVVFILLFFTISAFSQTYVQTGTWISTATAATSSAGSNNVTVVSTVRTGSNSTITFAPNNTFGSSFSSFWNPTSIAGDASLQFTYRWDTSPEPGSNPAIGDAGTRNFTIFFATPVKSFKLHLDRLGGGSYTTPSLSNSTNFTMTSTGISISKISGNSQFTLNGNSFYRTPNIDLGNNPSDEANTTTGTAAGTLLFTDTTGLGISSVNFTMAPTGVEGDGTDIVEMIVQTEVSQLDSDGDSYANDIDLDDDNDGILDSAEGNCVVSSSAQDNFDSPEQSNVNGNNYKTAGTPFNGWSVVGGARFNVIRTNGNGYNAGPDVAHTTNQYIDVDDASTFISKTVTTTTPTVVDASAWFANRDTQASNYPSAGYTVYIQITNVSGTQVAKGNNVVMIKELGQESWYKSELSNIKLPAGTYNIRAYVHDFSHVDTIKFCFSRDTDSDGIADYLDLDSDNDGCVDAIEGGNTITTSQLVTAGGTVTVGTGSTAINQNLCATSSCVDSQGRPTLTGTAGQTIGTSINNTQKDAACYNLILNPNTGSGNQGTAFTVSNVLANDTLNGAVPVIGTGAGQVTISQSGTWTAGITLNTTTGVVNVANTGPAGTYTLTYQVCVNNTTPALCKTTTVTITVNATIDAVNDNFSSTPINGINGGSTASVLTNDLSNGVTATLSNVNLTQVSTTNPNVTLNTSNGTVTVAPGTPAGKYTVTYRICDKITTTLCDNATVTVVVSTPTLDAVNQSQTLTAGSTGTLSVLRNDIYNGGAAGSATLSNINLTQVSTSNPGVTLNTATGMISVATGTPAGNYTITYRICDKINTSVCDTATETVIVSTTIDAVNDDFSGTPINGNNGGSTATVLTNDTLNGAAATLSNINISQISTENPGITLNTTNATVTVAPGTPYGTYKLTYQICDQINPTVCDTAQVTVFVTTIKPEANNDGPFTMTPGTTGTTSVLANDIYNGGAPGSATLGNINLSQISTTNPGVTLNTSTGMVSVAAGTPPGNYTITYEICDKVNPTFCDSATVQVIVQATYFCLTTKVFLQGAMINVNDNTQYPTSVMRDDLRVKNLIPTTQPYSAAPYGYTGTETITNPTTVFADNGNNSIVDWVLLELRNALTPTTIVSRRAALVQRDGDIVDVDGTSCVRFNNATAGTYFVSIRHRNHLGMMASAPIVFVLGNTYTVDFTSSALYALTGILEPAAITKNGIKMMWMGDTNQNMQLRYKGASNDTSIIYTAVMTHSGNTLLSGTYRFTAYSNLDANMNGEVRYRGAGNDSSPLYQNVIVNSVGNLLKSLTYGNFFDNIPGN